MNKSPAARRMAWALAAVSLGLVACEPKPSNPPKPTTNHIETPADADKRPVDLRLFT